jgi:hypothetical protein
VIGLVLTTSNGTFEGDTPRVVPMVPAITKLVKKIKAEPDSVMHRDLIPT